MVCIDCYVLRLVVLSFYAVDIIDMGSILSPGKINECHSLLPWNKYGTHCYSLRFRE